MPKVLIADELSPKALDIFRSRGVEVDVRIGLKKIDLLTIIGGYDGLAVRSATKADQEVIEAENLHFLGGFNAGGGLPHIVEFAPLRRAAVIERIALRIEMGLPDEGRHERNKQQHDEPG